jgi:hypothetical protein
MPKKAKYPKPAKRFVRGSRVILWRFSPASGQYRQYTVSTGLNRQKEDAVLADVVLRQFALALAQDPPAFPAEYAAAPGVVRYLDDRAGAAHDRSHVRKSVPSDFNALLGKYGDIKKIEFSTGWHTAAMGALRKWRRFIPDLGAATREDAANFLHAIHAKGKAKGKSGNSPKRRRILPLAAELRSLLEAVPEKNRVGHVVPISAEFDQVQRLETLARKIRKINAASENPIPEERIGWNSTTHY